MKIIIFNYHLSDILSSKPHENIFDKISDKYFKKYIDKCNGRKYSELRSFIIVFIMTSSLGEEPNK